MEAPVHCPRERARPVVAEPAEPCSIFRPLRGLERYRLVIGCSGALPLGFSWCFTTLVDIGPESSGLKRWLVIEQQSGRFSHGVNVLLLMRLELRIIAEGEPLKLGIIPTFGEAALGDPVSHFVTGVADVYAIWRHWPLPWTIRTAGVDCSDGVAFLNVRP